MNLSYLPGRQVLFSEQAHDDLGKDIGDHHRGFLNAELFVVKSSDNPPRLRSIHPPNLIERFLG